VSHNLHIAAGQTGNVSVSPTFDIVNAGTQGGHQAGELTHQPRQSEAPLFTFRGPWFSAKEASLYVPCRSVKAFYMWRTRHGIIARNNGSVAKADLDRELNRRKPRRQAPWLVAANLRRRQVVHAANSTPIPDSCAIPDLGASK
jgi:hypothetical protein